MNFLLANDTRGSVRGEHWGSWLTTTNLEQLLSRVGLTIADRLPLGRLKPVEAVWKRIEKAGMLVINGEGSVHSGTPTAVALLNSLKMARERNVRVWIVNHGCWNCDELIEMYKYADFIAVRDVASFGYLAQHGISARLAADCSFLSAPAQAARRNQLLVCSGLKPPEDSVVRRWARELKCSRIVLSNDFYPRFSGKKTAKSGSAEESFRMIASSRFVISSSFHGCIFAAIHAIPFLPVQVSGQPAKTMVAAVEAMGRHAQGVCFEGPGYVNAKCDEIQHEMRERARWLRKRASFNVPANS
ncbi:MAG: polysaccharide pyruvyl transferase family protein [Terracidiphilus sp.]|jgi:hypothetical protein